MGRYKIGALALLLAAAWQPSLQADEIILRDQELPTRLTVGYAVRLIDMNGDRRLDICIVDSERILWLENPNWDEHILIEKQTKKDNVCFASHDIDGDGQLDFAVGADWRPADAATTPAPRPDLLDASPKRRHATRGRSSRRSNPQSHQLNHERDWRPRLPSTSPAAWTTA